jgi:hypothetical protein
LRQLVEGQGLLGWLHDLRHAASMKLRREGVDTMTVMKIGGYKVNKWTGGIIQFRLQAYTKQQRNLRDMQRTRY